MPLEDDHHHCKSCGAVCKPTEEVCSERCRRKRAELARSRQTLRYVMYGAALVLIITLLFEIR